MQSVKESRDHKSLRTLRTIVFSVSLFSLSLSLCAHTHSHTRTRRLGLLSQVRFRQQVKGGLSCSFLSDVKSTPISEGMQMCLVLAGHLSLVRDQKLPSEVRLPATNPPFPVSHVLVPQHPWDTL